MFWWTLWHFLYFYISEFYVNVLRHTRLYAWNKTYDDDDDNNDNNGDDGDCLLPFMTVA